MNPEDTTLDPTTDTDLQYDYQAAGDGSPSDKDKQKKDNDRQQSNAENKKGDGKGSGDGEGKDGGKNSESQQPPPTILSWTIRGVSLLIVASLLGYFTYSWIRPTVKPAITFEVLTEEIEQRGTGWATPVKITNDGTMSVHELTVTGTLTSAAGQPSQDLTILLLGPNEQVQGTLWFSDDPRGKGLEMTVASYLLP